MADGPYGIEYTRVELDIFTVFFRFELTHCKTHVKDGTRPMTEKARPKTSKGVKLRLNSTYIVIMFAYQDE